MSLDISFKDLVYPVNAWQYIWKCFKGLSPVYGSLSNPSSSQGFYYELIFPVLVLEVLFSQMGALELTIYFIEWKIVEDNGGK